MRTQFILVVCLVTLLIGCESDGDIHLPEGKYNGHFTRSTVDEDGTPSEITLMFTANTFQGSGDIPEYPAICQGTYSIKGDKITFTNSCPWTADFDWTLILGGDYTINVDGNKVKFFRDYDGKQSDTYVLERNN
jgi:hypothetical protein